MSIAKTLVVGTAWYMATMFTIGFFVSLNEFTKPKRHQAPTTQNSYVLPSPLPQCEDTKKAHCDDPGILLPRYTATSADYLEERADLEAQQAQQHSRYGY
jgi:hypothetical protein